MIPVRYLREAALLASLAASPAAAAADLPPAVRAAAEAAIRQAYPQDADLAVTFTSRLPDLTACTRPAARWPASAPRLGLTTVVINCTAGRSYYLSAHVEQHAHVVVAARPLPAGQILDAGLLTRRRLPLSLYPGDIVGREADVAGYQLTTPVPSGAPLRRSQVKPPALVDSGQAVKALIQGDGFTAEVIGQALSSGSAGQKIRVLLPGGRAVYAEVVAAGTVLLGGGAF